MVDSRRTILAASLLMVASVLGSSLMAQEAKASSKGAPAKKPTIAEVIAAAPPSDWRPLHAEHTLVMELGQRPGLLPDAAPPEPIIIELAPRFAPAHVANILTLVREGYFDGLAVVRSQDNYVAQWGEAEPLPPAGAKPLGSAKGRLPAEFDIPLKGLPLQQLSDADGWAPVTGFVDGLPVAANPKTGRAWLAHCYGTVGAGRGMAPDSSTGASLYAVNGHAPRGLDLNITTVGRVVAGMASLASLPRGTQPLGFYATPGERTPIVRVRVLSDMPEAERPALQLLKTDSATWPKLLQARRVRQEQWFVHSHHHIGLCNAVVPTRAMPSTPSPSR
jgi:cyclophilin family peptidyl-prolyl cis-trans isomerase